MSEQQIAKLTGALVEHQRHFGAMSTDDRQWVIQNTGAAISLFAEAVKNRTNGAVAGAKKLLQFVTTAFVAAIESFKSSENFKENKKGSVQIYWIGGNFKKHFGRKEEGASEAIELKIHKLLESSLDAPIITELADKCEITLGQFFSLIQKQGKGEEGVLLTNGYANIAYIRDDEGVLWAVRADWSAGGGWSVEAYSVGDPRRWVDGDQVLSR